MFCSESHREWNWGYRSAHARSTYHVVSQTIDVSAQQAQIAYQLALQSGPVMDAFCASSISELLSQVPGFESITGTMSPNKLSRQFETIPGRDNVALLRR